jgi:hypothetical protein
VHRTPFLPTLFLHARADAPRTIKMTSLARALHCHRTSTKRRLPPRRLSADQAAFHPIKRRVPNAASSASGIATEPTLGTP